MLGGGGKIPGSPRQAEPQVGVGSSFPSRSGALTPRPPNQTTSQGCWRKGENRAASAGRRAPGRRSAHLVSEAGLSLDPRAVLPPNPLPVLLPEFVFLPVFLFWTRCPFREGALDSAWKQRRLCLVGISLAPDFSVCPGKGPSGHADPGRSHTYNHTRIVCCQLVSSCPFADAQSCSTLALPGLRMPARCCVCPR